MLCRLGIHRWVYTLGKTVTVSVMHYRRVCLRCGCKQGLLPANGGGMGVTEKWVEVF